MKKYRIYTNGENQTFAFNILNLNRKRNFINSLAKFYKYKLFFKIFRQDIK